MPVNKRIPETTYRALLEGNMQFVLYNPANDSTEHTLVSDVLGVAPDGLEWNSITAYPLDAIKSFEGNLWKSLITGNLDNPPQTYDPVLGPPTVNPFWVQVTQSQSGGLWVAGVFLDSNVTVYRVIDGILQEFFLSNTTRPFNSTNIETEWAAGDWLRVSDELGLLTVSTSGGTITLDFKNARKGTFKGSASISAGKAIAFTNSSQALEFDLHLVFSSVQAITLPAGTKMKSSAEWNPGTLQWTPLYAGAYSLHGDYDGTGFRVDQSGEDPYV